MTNTNFLASFDRDTAVTLVRAQRQWTEQLAADNASSFVAQNHMFTMLAQELVARFGNDAWTEAVRDA